MKESRSQIQYAAEDEEYLAFVGDLEKKQVQRGKARRLSNQDLSFVSGNEASSRKPEHRSPREKENFFATVSIPEDEYEAYELMVCAEETRRLEAWRQKVLKNIEFALNYQPNYVGYCPDLGQFPAV